MSYPGQLRCISLVESNDEIDFQAMIKNYQQVVLTSGSQIKELPTLTHFVSDVC